MELVDFNAEREMFARLELHRPFRSMDVFFDMTNHLLGTYTGLISGIAAYGVLVSYDGTVFSVQQMNCGYGGHGPHNTKKLLQWLGVDDDTAEDWIYHPGIHIEFDEQGNWINSSLRLTAPFDSREAENPDISLSSDRVYSNIEMRAVFFINPHDGNYRYLFNALHLCKPIEFTYYCGNDAAQRISYDAILNFEFRRSAALKRLAKGGFVWIHGQQYDVVCLAERDSICSLIQNLHSYFFGSGLFYETYIGDLIFFSETPIKSTLWDKLSLAKQVLFPYKQREFYDSKMIPQQPREQQKWWWRE